MQIHETSPGIRAILRELAKHPGGVHSSNAALSEWSVAQICVQGRRLVSLGQLFSTKVTHRHVRYFDTAANRDRFVQQLVERNRRAPGVRAKDSVTLGGSAPWPADAPAVRPPGLKVIDCPSHPPRYQEHVFPFVHNGLPCTPGFDRYASIFGRRNA
jgi:hypothetical protein